MSSWVMVKIPAAQSFKAVAFYAAKYHVVQAELSLTQTESLAVVPG